MNRSHRRWPFPRWASLNRTAAGVVTLLCTSALVTGAVPASGAGTAPEGIPVPGDPLPGSGRVHRTHLGFDELTDGTATGTITDSAFGLPAEAAMPRHRFAGRLELIGEESNGGFNLLRDDFGIATSYEPVRHLPEASLEFTQHGSHLIPAVAGLRITGSEMWNLMVNPGRAWSENGDHGWSRAAVPFTLVPRNANCAHNGTLTFLFNGSHVSQVRYQVTQETCLYFKFDMWGQVDAAYHRYPVRGARALRDAHAVEVANRLPTRPIEALVTDYPAAGVDLNGFGAGVTAEHLSTYGVLFNGVNYVAGCTTRQGFYPFCDVLRMPSYSVAKSTFAGTAMMRLARTRGPAAARQTIGRWVPEHQQAIGRWTDVTIGNVLDMASGNFASAEYMVDESSTVVSDFMLAESYADKIAAAFRFPRTAAPGTQWVYHTTDTFIAARAMQNYLGADIFDYVSAQVYVPARLSKGALTSLRTDNSPTGMAVGGFGMFFTRDDIAKLAKLYNNDRGVIAGRQVLDPATLAAAMQRDPADRGVRTTQPNSYYNNGFWGWQITPAEYPRYSCSFWVPVMSGYGGIEIVMLPNGATYYYFSDNDEFSWKAAMREAGKLAPYCPAG